MKMKIKKLGIVILLSVLSLSATGCLMLGRNTTTVGTYTYLAGNLKTNYDATLPQTWEAARTTIRQLDMKADIEDSDAFSGKLKGVMADGRDFTISLTKVTERTTEVGTRIGLGDQVVSETIHKKIMENIKK